MIFIIGSRQVNLGKVCILQGGFKEDFFGEKVFMYLGLLSFYNKDI